MHYRIVGGRRVAMGDAEYAAHRAVQLREADRLRNVRDKRKRNAASRRYAAEHYSRERSRDCAAQRRANGSMAFVDWLRSRRLADLRHQAKLASRCELLDAISAHEEWLESLDSFE